MTEDSRKIRGDRLRRAGRMAGIAPFHVVEIFTRARALEASGRSIIHMEVGEPDFPTPEPVLRAGADYLRAGDVHYTPSLGIPALRQAIARFYGARYGLDVSPGRIVVTAGASGALLLALGILVDPGDEILLPDPGYPCNRNLVRCFEGVPKAVPVFAETGYQPIASQIESGWSARTRGLLVASPANPTGTLIPGVELERLAAVVGKRGGVLLVDEIYHGLTYGSEPRTALDLGDHVFVINSFSKYFGMTGWRLGWLVAPPEYVRDLEKLAQNLFICPSAPAQHAALAAFEPATIEILERRRAEFRRRRDYLLPALRELGFVVRSEPEGAFYLYAESAGIAQDSHDFAWRLIEEAGVAVTPGIDFGENRPAAHLRFAYTNSIENLNEGVRRLAAFLGAR
jgi:aspartate/methionine/tyrosine aminotransferase